MQPHKRKREPRPGDHRGTAFNNPRPGTKWHALAAAIGYDAETTEEQADAALFSAALDLSRDRLATEATEGERLLSDRQRENLAIMEAADVVAVSEWIFGGKPKKVGNPGRDPSLEVAIAGAVAAMKLSEVGKPASPAIHAKVGKVLGLAPDTVRRACKAGWSRLHALALAPIDTEDTRAMLRHKLVALHFWTVFRRSLAASAEIGICKNA